MSKIVERVASRVEEHEFQIKECSVCGWQGTPDDRDLCEKCSGAIRIGKVTCFNTVPGYVLVECDCGETVCCQGFTSTCVCGADYNWAGQQLAPRSFWGEETGETCADILNGGGLE